MTHRLNTNCAKNYCNRTLIVKVIVENVVTYFWGHSVVSFVIVCKTCNSDVNMFRYKIRKSKQGRPTS